MKTSAFKILTLLAMLPCPALQAKEIRNPVIWADIPDTSLMRAGNTYYMSSTTMHMVPGVPVMKSENLADWQMCGYACKYLSDKSEMNLEGGKNAYGQGTWASSMRFHNGTFYVSTFSYTTGKTHIYSTKDPSSGKWEEKSFSPALHDGSLFFDDDGKVYMVYGGGNIRLMELNEDLSGVKEGGVDKIIIKDAQSITGSLEGLPAEGSQMFKANGKYYHFSICWPPTTGMRTALVYRADNIEGPYEGRIAIKDKGVAQGGIVDTPDGKWYGLFFRDSGAVGRVPYLVPMKWEDGWPVFGTGGEVPMALEMNAKQNSVPESVAVSDEFNRGKNNAAFLPLQWQWNHNPNNDFWSLSKRKGFLRLETFRQDKDFTQARNTLTQRAFGPKSSAQTCIDTSKMKDGDIAGLGLLQRKYATIEVKMLGGKKFIATRQVSKSGDKNGQDEFIETTPVPLKSKLVYFKADCDFENQKDAANFYYSLNGKNWTKLGGEFKMEYTLPHFMGYRFALFNYATKEVGGYADFDFFRVSDNLEGK